MDAKSMVLGDMLHYLESLSAEEIEELLKSDGLKGRTFYTKEGEILSQRAKDLYLKHIREYVREEYDIAYSGEGPRSIDLYFSSEKYDSSKVLIPKGIIDWINNFTEIESLYSNAKKERRSEILGSLYFALFITVSINLVYFQDFISGNITFFDVIGRVAIILGFLYLIFDFLFSYYKQKKNRFYSEDTHLLIEAVLSSNGKISINEFKQINHMSEHRFELAIKPLNDEELLEEKNGILYLNGIDLRVKHYLWKEHYISKSEEVEKQVEQIYQKNNKVKASDIQEKLNIRYSQAFFLLENIKMRKEPYENKKDINS